MSAVADVIEKPAKVERTILQLLDDRKVKDGIAAVAGRYMTSDRMLRLCVFAVKRTPNLLKCDPTTVLGAMMVSAALGLEPNTVQQQAFLIPYKKNGVKNPDGTWNNDLYECQFQVGARGFVTLAYRSPSLKSIFAETVHRNDQFDHGQGSETFLRFKKEMGERGEPIGAFSHARLANGDETVCLLPMSEIEKIRARSETFKSLSGKLAQGNDKDRAKAQRTFDETPWVAWFDEMGAKSAIKRHAKQLPLTNADGLAAASEIDSLSDIGKLDIGAMADPDLAVGVAEGDMPPVLEHVTSDEGGLDVVDTRERVDARPAMTDDQLHRRLAIYQADPVAAISMLSSKYAMTEAQIRLIKGNAA